MNLQDNNMIYENTHIHQQELVKAKESLRALEKHFAKDSDIVIKHKTKIADLEKQIRIAKKQKENKSCWY